MLKHVAGLGIDPRQASCARLPSRRVNGQGLPLRARDGPQLEILSDIRPARPSFVDLAGSFASMDGIACCFLCASSMVEANPAAGCPA